MTAGQHEQRFNFTEPLLWADLPTIARPFVKWSEEVRRLEDLPRAIHRAVKTALAPPMGPVFLSLPGDILTDSADLDLGTPEPRGDRNARRRRAIAQAAAIIAKANSPVIIAGDAVPQGNALQELVGLAETLGAPVYDEGMASRTMFPSSHPLYRGALVRLPEAIQGMLAQHDLLVSIGADLFTLSLPGEVEAMPEDYPVIHLDTNPWELAKNYPEQVSILGEPKVTLPELTEAILQCSLGHRGRSSVAKRLAARESGGRRQPAQAERHGRCAGGTSSDSSVGLDADDRSFASGKRGGNR